jgi:hypothetical protein
MRAFIALFIFVLACLSSLAIADPPDWSAPSDEPSYSCDVGLSVVAYTEISDQADGYGRPENPQERQGENMQANTGSQQHYATPFIGKKRRSIPYTRRVNSCDSDFN